MRSCTANCLTGTTIYPGTVHFPSGHTVIIDRYISPHTPLEHQAQSTTTTNTHTNLYADFYLYSSSHPDNHSFEYANTNEYPSNSHADTDEYPANSHPNSNGDTHTMPPTDTPFPSTSTPT